MQAEPGASSVWTLILVIGIGIFGIRLSFIQLHAYLDGIPPGIERTLKFVPAAIIAAIVFPDVFVVQRPLTGVGPLFDVLVSPRVVAGGIAAVTARRTGSILATVAVGMGILWATRLVIG